MLFRFKQFQNQNSYNKILKVRDENTVDSRLLHNSSKQLGMYQALLGLKLNLIVNRIELFHKLYTGKGKK